jgi:ribonuclease D
VSEVGVEAGEGDLAEEPLPPLELRDGAAPVITDTHTLASYASKVRGGSGPVALDAERASGYKYSARAYLVQVRREGAGTALIDPIDMPDLSVLADAIGEAEWILHAATQDLACLAELGMQPKQLFDTEVAARLLGRDKVSLAGLVASELGHGLAKGHGAADWSLRPLTDEQLTYAALDVEPLVEIRDILATDLRARGRWDIAEQEFTHLLKFQPKDRGADPWRRLSGMHSLKSPREWALARELWWERDSIASDRDVAPGRLLPDSAIVAAVKADPSSAGDLLETKGFHGRGAARYKRQWWQALERARALPKDQWPTRAPRSEGPPPPRAWAEKDPVAAERLAVAKEGVAALAEDWGIAPELLLSPELMRKVCWEPPDDLEDFLRSAGAREWQIAVCGPILRAALET